MHVRNLPLAPRFVEHFERRGIGDLYPPQAAAVGAGVCEGESVLAAVPTASGKTFVAQLGMLTCEGPALYVVPLRALATEKADAFESLPGIDVGVASGDYDATDEELTGHDVVVATAEKVDAGIRHGAGWVERVGCVALDEVHLLDQPSRGPTLEVTVAKLRRLNPDLQVVALSATVPNADAVASWLDAEVVHSDWRPVDLRRGVFADGTLAFEDGIERTPGGDAPGDDGGTTHSEGTVDDEGDPAATDDASATATLVADALERGGQCLVFVSSRRDARALASDLSMGLDGPLHPVGTAIERPDGGDRSSVAGEDADATADPDADDPAVRSTDAQDPPTASIADALRETAATATGETLADLADDGVAFHHAGLRSEHRRIVEEGFRNGELGVLCATPTLAAGVNVPARRVVVRDHRRYGDDGYESLSTLEVHQMFGRAGRPGLDPYGEAILVADDEDESESLRRRYLEDDPDPVTSKLDDPRALRPHVLASVASGLVASRAELHALLAETFYAHEEDPTPLVDTAEAALDRLAEAGMLVESEAGLSATELGALVSHVYVDPGTGADVVAALERVDSLERVTDLTVCEIVCDAEEMPTRYVTDEEAGALTDAALRHSDELARPVHDFEGDFHAWLSSLKTARLLADYAAGTPLDELVEGYAVGPGDVRRYAERAQWLLAATESLADHVGSDATGRIRETRERLEERTG